MQVNKDYLEIQADNSLEIAKHTALEAAKRTWPPAIREDHSLHINALGDTCSYMNYFEKRISVKNILKILSSFKRQERLF